MKKIFIVIIFVVFCFILPIILTNRKTEQTSSNLENDVATKIVKEEYKYVNYGVVKLLHKESGNVEEIKMDEYIYGVLSAEMPANYDIEALKAQAVVARTYTAYKILHRGKHQEADICDDSSCCQAWITKEKRMEKWKEAERENNWNKIVSAVDATAGKIITYNGEPINAFFHSNSGGMTEIVSNVWGGTDYPYLQSVATSGEEGYSQYQSSIVLTKQEVIEKLGATHPEIVINYESADAIKILEYTDSGRVRTIQFGNILISGVEARNIFGLKSAKFNITVGDKVVFDVIGYGHGVGLSQTGADAMAKAGSKYEEIIKHYYTGIKIENI